MFSSHLNVFQCLFVFVFPDARTYLRKLREDQIRDAAMVVQIWEEVLMNYAYNLGDERKSLLLLSSLLFS